MRNPGSILHFAAGAYGRFVTVKLLQNISSADVTNDRMTDGWVLQMQHLDTSLHERSSRGPI